MKGASAGERQGDPAQHRRNQWRRGSGKAGGDQTAAARGQRHVGGARPHLAVAQAVMTIVVYAHRYKRPPPLPADVTLVQLDPQFATTRRSSRWPRQRNFPKRLLGARVGLMEGPGLPQTSAPRSAIPGLARGSCAPPAQDSPSMARLRNLLERAAENRVGPMESTARGTPPPVHLSPALNPTARGFLRRSGPPTAAGCGSVLLPTPKRP
jgi:hypothetical protein